jgi:hypothetical protein
MKLVLFENAAVAGSQAGLMVDAGIVLLGALQPAGHDGQAIMRAVIDGFGQLQPARCRRIFRANSPSSR